MNFNNNFKLFSHELLRVLNTRISPYIKQHLASLLALNQSSLINNSNLADLVVCPIKRLSEFLKTYKIINENFSTILTLFIAAITENSDNQIESDEKITDIALQAFLKKEFYILKADELSILHKAILTNSITQGNFKLLDIIYENKNLIKDLSLLKNNFSTIHVSVVMQQLVENLIKKNNLATLPPHYTTDNSLLKSYESSKINQRPLESIDSISSTLKKYQIDENKNFVDTYNKKDSKLSPSVKW